MQYLAFFLPFLTSLFDSSKKSISEAIQDKFTQKVIIGVVLYYLLTKYLNEQEKAKLLNSDPSNTDAASYALRLHDAFHPYGKAPFGLPDGTDETAVKTIAAQMGVSKNFAEVSSAYYTLYGSDLKNDLTSEGVYDVFTTEYTKGLTTTPTSPTLPSNVLTRSNIVNNFQTGAKVATKYNSNIRNLQNPRTIVQTVKAGVTIGKLTGTTYRLTGTNWTNGQYAQVHLNNGTVGLVFVDNLIIVK